MNYSDSISAEYYPNPFRINGITAVVQRVTFLKHSVYLLRKDRKVTIISQYKKTKLSTYNKNIVLKSQKSVESGGLVENTVEKIVKSKVFRTFLEMNYDTPRVFETFVT